MVRVGRVYFHGACRSGRAEDNRAPSPTRPAQTGSSTIDPARTRRRRPRRTHLARPRWGWRCERGERGASDPATFRRGSRTSPALNVDVLDVTEDVRGGVDGRIAQHATTARRETLERGMDTAVVRMCGGGWYTCSEGARPAWGVDGGSMLVGRQSVGRAASRAAHGRSTGSNV